MQNDRKIRVAVASSDGIVVNSHFGRARDFYIYEVSENEDTVLLEKRELVPICEAGNHDEGRLRDNVKRLSDCDYVAVSRIGMGALRVMNEYGIAAMELPGEIEDSLHRIVVYDQTQGLMTTR